MLSYICLTLRFIKTRIDLTLGEEHDLEALSKHLTHIGYQRVEQVLSPGEYSRRGDILDIYEMTSELPYRLEFFGDEIDGIRQFDSDSQKSLDNLEACYRITSR